MSRIQLVQHVRAATSKHVRSVLAALLALYGVATVTLALFHEHTPSSYVGYFPAPITGALAATTMTVGIAAIFLAHGLGRGKRRAMALSTVALAAATITQAAHGHWIAASTALLIAAALVAYREQFQGSSDTSTRRAALVVPSAVLGLGFVTGLLMLTFQHGLVGADGVAARVLTILRNMVGLSGPIGFLSESADWRFGFTMGAFTLGATIVGAYLYLRAGEPAPFRTTEETHALRTLIEQQGDRDSLSYFATREDKSVVFSPSGKAAITYRVVAGVALISGDPIGNPEGWREAVEEYLKLCATNSWVPGVLGCSAAAARRLARHGLHVLEIGDEAIIDPRGFSLDGRSMRNVRQAVNRVVRQGAVVTINDVASLTPSELAEVEQLAVQWRPAGGERGFSMALGGIGGPGSIIAMARDSSTNEPLALLQMVPWGSRGWSLDLMRRSPTATSGVNELLICSVLDEGIKRDIEHVSLNFAMLRQAFAQGERLGAGWLSRAWAAVLRFASRWYQLESLYRFNDKFQPTWVPRYLCYQHVIALPRIMYASMEAERFVSRISPLAHLSGRTVLRSGQLVSTR